MKLTEISYQLSDQQLTSLTNDVRKYTNDYEMPSNLTQTVDTLLQHDIAKYHGEMYRFIAIPSVELLKRPTTQNFISLIHKWDIKKNQQYLSWAVSIPSGLVAISYNIESGIYDHLTGKDGKAFPVFGCLEQTGEALDVTTLLGEENVINKDEQELLAKYTNNTHLVGFSDNKFFNIHNFKEFIQHIRREQERYA
jgi:hypothetical protein